MHHASRGLSAPATRGAAELQQRPPASPSVEMVAPHRASLDGMDWSETHSAQLYTANKDPNLKSLDIRGVWDE